MLRGSGGYSMDAWLRIYSQGTPKSCIFVPSTEVGPLYRACPFKGVCLLEYS